MRFLTAIALLLIACGEEEPILVRVDLPFDSEHRSALIVTGEGEKMAIYAVNNDSHIDPVMQKIALADQLAIEVLLYRNTLEELDFHPGEVERAKGSNPARLLPTPDKVQQGGVQEGASQSWRSATMVSDAVASFRASITPACETFTVNTINYTGASNPSYATAIGEPNNALQIGVLFGDEGGSYIVKDLSVEPVAPLPEIPQVRFGSAHCDFENHLWIGVEDGEIWEGLLDYDDKRIASAQKHGSIARHYLTEWIHGPVGRPAEVLFLIAQEWNSTTHTDGGSFERYVVSQKEAEYLFDFTPVPGVSNEVNRGAVVYVNDDEALALWKLWPEVVRYGGNTGRSDLVADFITHVEGLGSVFGTDLGQILSDKGNGPEELGSFAPIKAIAAYRGGIVFATQNQLQQYVPGVGFCDAVAIDVLPRYIVVVNRDLVVIGTEHGNSVVRWLSRT